MWGVIVGDQDGIILDANIAFESADNEVVLVSRGGKRRVPKAPKSEIAVAILDEVERLLADV